MKPGRWLSVTVATMAAMPAWAQDVPPSSPPTGIEDIIVTATRRSESAMSVPISITALDTESLDRQGIRDIHDLGRLVPGLSLVPSGPAGGVQVVIRGITSLAGASTTGVYINDTPIQARDTASIYPLIFDLERVEVLRGPQGTLFGAGSQGGTIRFITPAPSLDTTTGYGRAGWEMTKNGSPSYELGYAAGLPLIEDELGIRASFWTRHDGGYVDRVSFFRHGETTDRDSNSIASYVGRVAALWQVADNLRIQPSVFFQKARHDDDNTIWRDAGEYKSYYDIPQPTQEKFLLPALSIDYDFGSFEFKSITSRFMRDQNGTNRFFHSFAQGCPPGGQAPGYPADRCGLLYPQIPNYTLADHIDRTQRNWSQEFRLTSTNDGPLSWVVGVFYQNNKQTYYEDEDEPLAGQLTNLLFGLNVLEFGGVGQDLIDGRYAFIQNTMFRDKEIAGYGDFTYAVTDRLKATLGLRYSKTSFSFHNEADGPYGASPSGPSVSSGSSSETPFTPKFNLSYGLDEGLVYATVAKGYRMGGANPILPNLCAEQLASLGINGAAPPYESDTVWSYEIGAKKRLFGSKVEIAGSVYRIDWTGIQGDIPLNTCALSFTSNFGKAQVKGFDVQMQMQPTQNLLLSGTVAYNDGQYKETVPQPGNSSTLLALDGAPIPYSPKWQATASAEYSWNAGADSRAYMRADYHYTGKFFRNDPEGVIGYLASTRNGAAIEDVALRAGVTKGDFDVSVFVKNLFDNKDAVSQQYSSRLGTYGSRAERYTIMRPRTFGVTLTYRH